MSDRQEQRDDTFRVRPGGRPAGKIAPVVLPLSVFGLVLAAWALASLLLPTRHQYLFPSPLKTAVILWESLPELLVSAASSFLILGPGFLGAVAFGVLWGLVVGTSRPLRHMFIPFARVVAPVPATVYIPYAIALLPTFRSSAIFIVLLAAFWPVFMNTAAGALTVPEPHNDSARALGFSRFEYVTKVVFPSALPHIFNGMHVGLGMAFVMLTVAELFGSTSGLGRFVQYYADYADFPRMLAGILFTGLITFLAMTCLGWLQRRLIFWPY